MKNIITLSVAILIALSLTSCEDVIQLDLTDEEPRIIIEGTLDAGTATAQVILSESNGFYATTEQQFLSGANITLSNSTGSSFILSELSKGVYEANNIPIVLGEEMQLVVDYDQKVYTATSIVPQAVTLDSVEVNIITPPFGPDESFVQLIASWEDPEEDGNYYRVKAYQNDTLINNNINLTSDELSNGKRLMLGVRNRFEFESSAVIELLSVDKQYYDYFISVDAVIGGGFNSSSPFNPKGNFDNNALGYFGVFSSSKKTVSF